MTHCFRRAAMVISRCSSVSIVTCEEKRPWMNKTRYKLSIYLSLMFTALRWRSVYDEQQLHRREKSISCNVFFLRLIVVFLSSLGVRTNCQMLKRCQRIQAWFTLLIWSTVALWQGEQSTSKREKQRCAVWHTGDNWVISFSMTLTSRRNGCIAWERQREWKGNVRGVAQKIVEQIESILAVNFAFCHEARAPVNVVGENDWFWCKSHCHKINND